MTAPLLSSDESTASITSLFSIPANLSLPASDIFADRLLPHALWLYKP